MGAKRPVTVQLVEAASEPPHELLTIWKGEVVPKGESVIGRGPGLVTVKGWSALMPPTSTPPKAWLGGLIVGGGGATPVPESAAETLPELAVEETAPLAPPRGITGVYWMFTTQVPLGARLEVHVVLVTVNGPVVANGVSVMVVGLGFVTVNAWIALEVPNTTEPKSWLGGEMIGGGGAMALPVIVIERAGLPPASSQM